MTITKDDAAQALGEIDAARSRVWQTKAYGYASPFLIIWGLVWMVADLANPVRAALGPRLADRRSR